MPAEPVPPRSGGASQGAPQREEDAVLQRIQSAIPDLHLLLNRYRETSGQLGERELTLRHTEAEKMKVMEQKDTYIERLTKERDEALHKRKEENNRHAEEKSRLRLEIGNMTEQHNELQEKLQIEKKAREDTEKVVQESQAQHALLVSQSSAEKAAMARGHEDLIGKMSKELEAMESKLRTRENEFAERLQQQNRESAALLETRIMDVERKHRNEKEALESTWSRHRRQLEDAHTKLRRDLDDAKNVHNKTLDEHSKQHNQDKEAWNRERQSLIRGWESERAKMGQGSVELHSQHQKEKEELQKGWKSSQTRLEKEHAESKARMQAEIDRLKAGRDADKSRFNGVIAELRATTAKLDTENTKLQKLADAFEQVTDLRGREDAY